jgi:hypothetical protein
MGNGLRIQMRQIYCSLYRLHRCLDGRNGAEGEPEGTENTGCGKWIKQAGRTFIKFFGIPRFELRIANFELRNNCIRFSSNPQSAIHRSVLSAPSLWASSDSENLLCLSATLR